MRRWEQPGPGGTGLCVRRGTRSGVPSCCGQFGAGGNPCAAALAAASHLQAVPWVSPCPAQPWGLCTAQGVGTWGCAAAWDTRWQGSATHGPHRTGVAAGARDMLPPQHQLTRSEPPSLPTAFGLHPRRPASFDLHPAPFFVRKLLLPPEPHLHLMIFALRSPSPLRGNGVGGCSHSTMCMGRACSIWDPLHLAEELACAALPWHTRTPQQTGAPTQLPILSACQPWGGDSLGIPASCHCPTRVSLGKGTPLCHSSPGLSPNPAGFTRQGPLRLPGPGAALAACPPCRAPLGTMVRAGSRDAARS